MASLYPEFFRASANTGYALYADNRYEEALVFARRAASPKSEFEQLSWDLVGRLALGLNRFEEAQDAFHKAGAATGSSAAVRLASALAAQGQGCLRSATNRVLSARLRMSTCRSLAHS